MMWRRKGIAEHPFGTLKRRMDSGRFLVRGLLKVKAEMALAVTANNLTRAITVLGVPRLCQALVASSEAASGFYTVSEAGSLVQSVCRSQLAAFRRIQPITPRAEPKSQTAGGTGTTCSAK